MANTLTALAPTLFSAMQSVPRELTGLTTSVNVSFDDKMASKHDTVKVPIIGAATLGDYTPAMTTTAGTDQTPTTVSLTLDYAKQATFNLTGEEEQSLMNGGDNAKEFLKNNVEQAIRSIINNIETNAFAAARKECSRAFGTAGTTPFASGITEIADTLKILMNNGVESDGQISLVNSTAAYVNLMKNVTINNQPQGSTAADILAMGELANLYGVRMKASAASAAVTIGTGSTITASANAAAGAVSFGVTITAGTIVAGDVLTIGSHKYVVKTGAAATGTITINAPGLQAAVTAGDAVTINSAFTPNLMVHKQFMALKVRPQFLVPNANIEQTIITDPKTGLSLQFCKIAGDGMYTYRVQGVYGFVVVNPHMGAILLG
jgi:hypothetical protein